MAGPVFQKAQKSALKLRLALSGPSGSGKTMSALRIARGLVGPTGRIALVDTENGSAALYSEQFDFDMVTMTPPYLVKKYIAAWDAAEAGGYDCLIVDSLSHAWAGEGGILERKTDKDARGGNQFTNWAEFTKEHEALKNRILHPKSHLICTLRVKTDWVVESNDKGKQAPKKVGLAPVQREGLEYEFDVFFNIALNHSAIAEKDRTSLFEGRMFLPDESIGKEFLAWLKTDKAAEERKAEEARAEKRAAEAPPPPPEPPPFKPSASPEGPKVTEAQLKRLYAMAGSSGWADTEVKDQIVDFYGLETSKDLSSSQYQELVGYIIGNPREATA